MTAIQQKISGTESSLQNSGLRVGILFESAQDSIVAKASPVTQTTATAILNELSRVTTVATAGDGIALPKAFSGMTLVVINKGANAMQVFGNLTDTIDDIAGSLGVSQMPNSVVIYACVTDGAWYTEGLATGFVSVGGGNYATLSYQDGITASVTQTQLAATPITASIVTIAICANAQNAVLLPPAKPGMEIAIINNGAQSAQAFPASAANGGAAGGDQINALGQNAGLQNMTNSVPTIFYCTKVGQWFTK